ncbi:acyl-CoA dehydrogenase family protein [Rhodococcus sp. NPDC057014]|uniref:acyl-CoA dehydrogenase family protein n=1 Tax=Rhodococcus sp. NPDC057014 TaxID=3346000 RepID=UPI003643AA58
MMDGSSIRLAEQFRSVFLNKIDPEIRERCREETTKYPEDIVAVQRVLNEHGLAVPHWPTEWGGRNWTPWEHHLLMREMGRAGVPEPLTFNVDMIGPVIARFGTEEQKARFLGPTANLDIWWCQGFSEPDAGSDLAALRTRAELHGDHFVVNGQKAWTTYAQHADWMFALVRTDGNAVKKQAGISLILIDMSSPGVEVRPIRLIDGSHEVNEVFLTDVKVPRENIVGDLNSGWSYAKFLLSNERARIARVGVTRSKIERIKRLAGEDLGDGRGLLEDRFFRRRVAEIENQLMALESAEIRAISETDFDGPGCGPILKLVGSQLQTRSAELLMDVAGRYGMVSEGPEKLAPLWSQRSSLEYLAWRKVEIYGGSTEVQRMLIASQLLGA